MEIVRGGHAAREVGMKRYSGGFLLASCVAIGLAGVNLSGRAGTTIAAQVAAAHAVAFWGGTAVTVTNPSLHAGARHCRKGQAAGGQVKTG
jgi:hypothetical protein